MTITDATNQLWSWFETHDSFELERDTDLLCSMNEEFDTSDPEATKATIELALERLKEMKFIDYAKRDDKAYYVLERSFDAFEQTVSINPHTAKFVQSEINEFCDILNDKTDYCETSNISEKEIRNLINIILYYKSMAMNPDPTAMLDQIKGSVDFNVNKNKKKDK